jgi:predicted nucleic acid-binding protein
MNESFGDVFADTVFWVGMVVRQDQHHQLAQRRSTQIRGRIVTTRAVLLEATNALSRPQWRSAAASLIGTVEGQPHVEIVPLSEQLWQAGWDLFSKRPDKAWSLTDCTSFVTMKDYGLTNALTGDAHFVQAGFVTLL